MSEVKVVEYDPVWPKQFEEIRASLWPALRAIAIAIEHVGSTSVPGLAAKPIIDLDIVVSEAKVPAGIKRLHELGYEHRGDLGIRGREAFRCPSQPARHHLYLCTADGPPLANHLAIRDYLRTHPSEARTYGELKMALARQFAQDIDGYMEAKTGFLVEVLRKLGFPKEALDEIVTANTRR